MYSDKFIEKIEEEMDEFVQEETSLTPQEIFADAKKIVFFTEIAEYFRFEIPEDYAIKALLQFENIIDTLWETFKDEGNISFNTEDDIEYFLRGFIRNNCYIEEYDY